MKVVQSFVMAATLLAGCATPGDPPEGTSMLLEVAHVLTRQEILTGQVRMPLADGERDPVYLSLTPAQEIPTGQLRMPLAYGQRDSVMIPMYLGLLASGMQSGDMVDGSVILGRTQYFWDDPQTGSVRGALRVLPVARGLEVSAGNVVEAERGYRFATVIRVKYRTLAEGGCFYGTDDGTVSGLTRDALRPVGRDEAASLRCAGLASEGWTQVRRCNGIEWTKPSQPGRTRAAFYGESRTLDPLNRAILAPFLSCYALTP
jgi:hypothetical protein